MKQSLHLGQEVQLSTEQRTELRHELKLQLVKDFAFLLEGQQEKTLPPAVDALKTAVAKDFGEQSVKNLETDPSFLPSLLQTPELLVTGNRGSIVLHLITPIHEQYRGEYPLQSASGSTEQCKVNLPNLHLALLEPKKVRAEINTLQATIKRGGGGQGTVEAIRGYAHSLQVAEALKAQVINPYLPLIEKLVKGGNVNYFLVEHLLAKSFTPIVAERTLNKFAQQTVSGISRQTPEKFATPFLNVLGQYILVSMGVIDPTVFQLRKGDVDMRDLSNDLRRHGVDLDKLLQRYNLQKSGTVFANRWALKGVRLTRETDEAVRDFIVGEVRKHAQSLLDAMGYREFFLNLRTELMDTESDDRGNVAREHLVKFLESPAASHAILVLCKQDLLPGIVSLMNMKHRK